MPRPKPILALASLAVGAVLLAGCGGGGDDPKPSIPLDNAQTMVAKLQEIQDNVDNGSCIIATEKVQEFQTELTQLPSSVNGDVSEALDRGSQNLLGLIDEQCSRPEETTTEETVTEDTETQDTETEETETQTTTTTPTAPTTPTVPTPNPGGGGGVGPPGSDGL